MHYMNCHAYFILVLVLFNRAVESNGVGLPTKGSSSLMSSEFTGDNYYLGCDTDHKCSIFPISGAQLHDGWSPTDATTNGKWGFVQPLNSWALDVQATGTDSDIFANTDETHTLPGQVWIVYPWYVCVLLLISGSSECKLLKHSLVAVL
jgi:hypothetical protein